MCCEAKMATANWQSERCDHCMENHTFFFRTSWKDSLSKKFGLECDLSCIIWKDAVSFSETIILTLSQRNTWKYDIFFRCFERWSSKRPGWNMTFLVLSRKMIFVFSETRYFFFGKKMKDDLSQEIHGGMVFSVYTCRRYKRGVRFLRQKNQRWSSSAKIHLKMIDTIG